EAEQCMKSLLAEQYRQTTHRLEEHRAVLDGIANALMERETISGDEVRDLVRCPVPEPAGRNGQAA
ncbi:MAG: hypothetical protein KBA71_04770, partial [Opitutaceae bacterium]|nr:hypothetical protein [Opitutaceae bacterium]